MQDIRANCLLVIPCARSPGLLVVALDDVRVVDTHVLRVARYEHALVAVVAFVDEEFYTAEPQVAHELCVVRAYAEHPPFLAQLALEVFLEVHFVARRDRRSRVVCRGSRGVCRSAAAVRACLYQKPAVLGV